MATFWDVLAGIATGGISTIAQGIAGADQARRNVDAGWNPDGSRMPGRENTREVGADIHGNRSDGDTIGRMLRDSSNGSPVSGVGGAASGGVINQAGTQINAGGIGGLFGANRDYPIYVPGTFADNTYSRDRQQVADQLGNVRGQEAFTAGPAVQSAGMTSAGSTIEQQQQAQFRQRQMALGDALMAQANGQGPSVAGSQLRQSTEMNLQAALAQAASSRGGNLGAAQYQLGNARANIQQQAAQQMAQTRIQEQMAARSQLGDVLNAGRGADIGLALNQAQLGQQNSQFNTGQLNNMNQFNTNQVNSMNQFNTSAQIDQRNSQNAMIAQLMQAGYSQDQANYLSTIQQQQYNTGLVAQQTAAANNVSVANSAQGVQLGAGLIGAAGAAASGGATALGAYAASRAATGK